MQDAGTRFKSIFIVPNITCLYSEVLEPENKTVDKLKDGDGDGDGDDGGDGRRIDISNDAPLPKLLKYVYTSSVQCTILKVVYFFLILNIFLMQIFNHHQQIMFLIWYTRKHCRVITPR